MLIIVPLIIIVGVVAWLLRPRRGMPASGYKATLTIITLAAVLAVTAVVFQMVHNASGAIEVYSVSNNLFIASLGLVVVGVLMAIGLVATHKNIIARGLGFGTCMAFVILVIQLALLEWLGGV